MTLRIESTTSAESLDTIASFLNTHASGVLITSDKAANPHGAVVYFHYHDDYTLTFATKSETQKNKNMEENAEVAFVVYDEKEQTQVQITGRVQRVEDEADRLDTITNMYVTSPKLSMSSLPPAEKLLAGKYIAYRLLPMVIKMAIFSRPDAERDDMYETVLLSER